MDAHTPSGPASAPTHEADVFPEPTYVPPSPPAAGSRVDGEHDGNGRGGAWRRRAKNLPRWAKIALAVFLVLGPAVILIQWAHVDHWLPESMAYRPWLYNTTWWAAIVSIVLLYALIGIGLWWLVQRIERALFGAIESAGGSASGSAGGRVATSGQRGAGSNLAHFVAIPVVWVAAMVAIGLGCVILLFGIISSHYRYESFSYGSDTYYIEDFGGGEYEFGVYRASGPFMMERMGDFDGGYCDLAAMSAPAFAALEEHITQTWEPLGVQQIAHPCAESARDGSRRPQELPVVAGAPDNAELCASADNECFRSVWTGEPVSAEYVQYLLDNALVDPVQPIPDSPYVVATIAQSPWSSWEVLAREAASGPGWTFITEVPYARQYIDAVVDGDNLVFRGQGMNFHWSINGHEWSTHTLGETP